MMLTYSSSINKSPLANYTFVMAFHAFGVTIKPTSAIQRQYVQEFSMVNCPRLFFRVLVQTLEAANS